MANLDTKRPVKHEVNAPRVERDPDTDRITQVVTDEQVSHKSDLAVQIPDEVNRDAADFDETRSAPTPEEAFEQAAQEAPADEPSEQADTKPAE